MTRVATEDATLTDGIDPAVRHLVPEGVCRTFRVMPYAAVDGVLLVAAADAEDAITEHVVAERIDRPVRLVRHTALEVLTAVDEAFPPVAEVETSEARRARQQLAQMLTRSGLVSDDELQRAVLEYSRTGDPLGDILVTHGAITEDVLVAALSEAHQLQRVGLSGLVPEPELARRLPHPLAQRLQVLPVAETADALLLAVARPLCDEALREVREALDRPFRQLLANGNELDELIQRVHRQHYSRVAAQSLMETRPDYSAHRVVSPAQTALLTVCVAALAVCGVVWPVPSLVALVGLASLAYLVTSVYKFRLTLRSLGSRLEADITDDDVGALDERELPVYSILVPLYQEAAMVPSVVAAIEALDYPRTRLDVRLLCEEDDDETIAAVRGLALPPHFRLVVVPDSRPKTKPKACNYGLQLAVGTYVVIFDAEDRPEPDQLKKAVIAFDRAPSDVVCLQAKLNYYNQDQNLLTGWFANEYAVQFELVLPAMGAAESPITLGGSSNHFVTAKLRELGAWDPFNVTEDADLGIRLHREGYRTAVLDSTTFEEATSQVGGWVRQRSRWTKGFYQTWLVHMRNPLRLLAQTGVRGFSSFNLTMGSAFVLLLNPVFWSLTTLWTLTQWGFIEQLFPGPVYYLAAAMLLVGNFVFVYLNLAGSLHRGEFGLTRVALLSPLYWGLMSWAAWRGFLQLFTKPFHWEKTVHGLDRGAA